MITCGTSAGYFCVLEGDARVRNGRSRRCAEPEIPPVSLDVVDEPSNANADVSSCREQGRSPDDRGTPAGGAGGIPGRGPGIVDRAADHDCGRPLPRSVSEAELRGGYGAAVRSGPGAEVVGGSTWPAGQLRRRGERYADQERNPGETARLRRPIAITSTQRSYGLIFLDRRCRSASRAESSSG